MKILTWFKSHYYIILPILLLSVISLMNFHSNQFIMGLDNISPYFNSRAVLDKLFGSETGAVFANLPFLFTLPIFELLKLISIPIWAINQLYLMFGLWMGVLGTGYLVYRITKSKKGFLFGSVLSLANLATFWIFNQPNYFFVAAFASIPWLMEWGIGKPEKNLVLTIIRITAVILFFQTTMNLVVFISYLFAILLIQFAINTSRVEWKSNLITQTKRLGIILLILLIVWQAGIFLTGKSDFVVSKLVTYYSSIKENPLTKAITKDLQASGIINNNIVNNIVFKNSWVETHTTEGIRLFQSYDYYSGPIFLIGLIPFVLALSTLFNSDRQKKIPLHFALIVGLILMSSIMLKATQGVPVLSEAFRWSASKFWPLIIFPIILLATDSLVTLKRPLITGIVFGLLLIYILPMFTGNLFSKELVTKLPGEYFKLDNNIKSETLYYYLPAPQDLYFYTYKFGYFGSDFVSYMTKGDTQKTGILSYFNNVERYKSISKSLVNCESKIENIKIIWDSNVETGSNIIKNCLDSKYNLTSKDRGLYIYE
ncbi:MAG: hypothetical protein UT34_C0001G0328 [candidate division WS6 bacterium GW2011_GWF2_39_15]|uniref:Glycosyltransferase RgtA/B/C/D-like domain-containing protein n=1 Tax=candidate division WS6 bacterium GW2011_GWF2_39_15 TaxID=1619100 RepID=A0A0G0MT10_9BACT|nr:MAG: hypothetical protein UT34_C0001G0328 [candidate division WS6 bacterium GW2011_GWF2_39_15]